jgi:hypothetical protein
LKLRKSAAATVSAPSKAASHRCYTTRSRQVTAGRLRGNAGLGNLRIIGEAA